MPSHRGNSCAKSYPSVQCFLEMRSAMLRKPPASGKPSWAKAVRTLRENLKLNQGEFGSRLGFSAMAVSRWERGAQEPPSHGYIGLGNLARDSTCWYFWERAGLRSEHVLRVLPTLERNTRVSKLQNCERRRRPEAATRQNPTGRAAPVKSRRRCPRGKGRRPAFAERCAH